LGSKWQVSRLKDACSKIGSGATPRGGNSVYLDDGEFALIRSQNVRNESFDHNGLAFIEKHHADKLSNVIVEDKDVLLNITGDSVARCCQVDAKVLPARVNQHVAIIRPTPDILDAQYLRYYFVSPLMQNEMLSLAGVGATRNALTKGMIEGFEIPLPPLPEQKAIAHILGTLDDKIELNRRMNATLEGMAQALFKSWFVDFDPVIDNALAAGNPIPDELAARAEVRRQALADGTANREAAKPFPDSFQETESMGWIPEGWEVRPLDKIANYQNGLALQKFRPKLGEDPLPVVKIAQLKTGDATWGELASPSIKPECILDNGDVVFSWSGSLMVTLWCGGEAALNQHLFKVTSQEFPKWVYLYWTKKHLSDFQKIAADKAVTMGHIKRSHLAEAMCALPSVDLIEEGTQILSPILDLLIRNDLVSRTSARLRDTLLPKLISGELRIPEAEQLIEKK
jgi:type I restriction enzyme, S subunit